MYLLLNTLSRFIITFLPRSKYLLISWLPLPSAVILEPKKIVTSPLFPLVFALKWGDKMPWSQFFEHWAEHWSGLPFPSLGDLLTQGLNSSLLSPAWANGFFATEPPGKIIISIATQSNTTFYGKTKRQILSWMDTRCIPKAGLEDAATWSKNFTSSVSLRNQRSLLSQ